MSHEDNLLKALRELGKYSKEELKRISSDESELKRILKDIGRHGREEFRKISTDDSVLNKTLKDLGKQGREEWTKLNSEDGLLSRIIRQLAHQDQRPSQGQFATEYDKFDTRKMSKMNHSLMDPGITGSLNRKANEVAFSIGNGLQIGAGGLMAVLGAVGFTISASHIAAITDFAPIIAMLLLGVLPMAAGVVVINNARKKAKVKKGEFIEKKILQLASRCHGRITAYELSMNSSLSVEQARNELDTLHSKGIMDIKLTDEGVIVYEVKEMLSGESKYRAKNII